MWKPGHAPGFSFWSDLTVTYPSNVSIDSGGQRHPTVWSALREATH
ncbi:MAG: hypothetical protein JWN85_3115 [Gammaproteobacteria bacterium]|nr:hypothetical protein [Gammaproteobacteria bacterium]